MGKNFTHLNIPRTLLKQLLALSDIFLETYNMLTRSRRTFFECLAPLTTASLAIQTEKNGVSETISRACTEVISAQTHFEKFEAQIQQGKLEPFRTV